MDFGSKFDRAELPLDDDEFQLGKKRGRGDVGDEGDGGQSVTTETEGVVTTRSTKVYSVFPFWIEASTPIVNLYGDREVTGDYIGFEDGFQYDADYDLKRVTYYDYGRSESPHPTQVPMPAAADVEGNANPKETTLVHPSVTQTPFTPSKVPNPKQTSTVKPIGISKDRSSFRPTRTTLSTTTTLQTSTTTRRIETTPTKLRSPKPTSSESTFPTPKSTLIMTSSSHKGQNQTPETSKTTRNIATSAASPLPSNPTLPTVSGLAIKSSTVGKRDQPAKVSGKKELDDHVASTASPLAYEAYYDYGEKEYGVNEEGSLESDLLKLLDKIARRYNESAEGV